ncbi:MAG: dehydrogenase, partial [Candidatus Sericytochromatia bacterium]|nr:dehydrogenase [Candidatus Sericytochromatia bacterium]
MSQLVQGLDRAGVERLEVPVPVVRPGHLLIRTRASVVSLGTERMLVEFARASWWRKARLQPERVRQVLAKVRSDGLAATLGA